MIKEKKGNLLKNHKLVYGNRIKKKLLDNNIGNIPVQNLRSMGQLGSLILPPLVSRICKKETSKKIRETNGSQ